MTRFGKMLREEREKAGMTMGDVGRALGVSVSYISDVELLRRKPLRTEQIVMVAATFGCDPTPLMDAAARERGAVSIATKDPRVQSIAMGLARSADRLTPAQLAEIERILNEREEP